MVRSVTLFTFVAIVAACGGGAQHAVVSQGPMPQGGSFTGVWHSPQYGEMHLIQTGENVAGCFVKDERHGRIQGRVSGNVMRYEWSENRELVSGRPMATRGHGYFVYTINGDEDHRIDGEWGNEESDSGGGPWEAVRDRRRGRRPDPECRSGGQPAAQQGDSFGGDSFNSGGGNDWGSDSGGGSSGGGRESDPLFDNL